ncbi:hypothetical protein Pst134EA_007648 [Puccinia striiformis f. sp. tritici]|uniref:hypothetical protein n=1 Tax=Puccinia striiformis f. sp. tritici TaxID=168172 RepID=UPI002008131F|nr:hypothetical protein Pst134EA_007648 [Puccinia striiformis f. sp. tritici]KAH9470386.1 hypothetical protein Pst134EA_007648 [Puccinia striiformis f. sp. tritici]
MAYSIGFLGRWGTSQALAIQPKSRSTFSAVKSNVLVPSSHSLGHFPKFRQTCVFANREQNFFHSYTSRAQSFDWTSRLQPQQLSYSLHHSRENNNPTPPINS